MENSRLQGVTQFSAAELKGLLDTFTNAIREKSKEIEELRLENLVLAERLEMSEQSRPSTQTYDNVACNVATVEPAVGDATGPAVPPPKTVKARTREKPNSKATSKKIYEKCRSTVVKPRFVIELPDGATAV